MAVAMHLRCSDLRPDRYDEVMASLDLDANPPIGELAHLALERPHGIEIVEVWQTREAAEAFVENRLRPALRDARAGDVAVEFSQLHNAYTPDIDTLSRLGAVSVPGVLAGSALY